MSSEFRADHLADNANHSRSQNRVGGRVVALHNQVGERADAGEKAKQATRHSVATVAVRSSVLPFCEDSVELFGVQLGKLNFSVLRHAAQDLHEHLNQGPGACCCPLTSGSIFLSQARRHGASRAGHLVSFGAFRHSRTVRRSQTHREIPAQTLVPSFAP